MHTVAMKVEAMYANDMESKSLTKPFLTSYPTTMPREYSPMGVFFFFWQKLAIRRGGLRHVQKRAPSTRRPRNLRCYPLSHNACLRFLSLELLA